MAVVNSTILTKLAFNDYKHDQGGDTKFVFKTVSPTLPEGVDAEEGMIFADEESTMKNILPAGTGNGGPGENLSNWSTQVIFNHSRKNIGKIIADFK